MVDKKNTGRGGKSAKRKRNLDDWLLLSKPYLERPRLNQDSQTRGVVSEGTCSERIYIDLTIDDSDDDIPTHDHPTTPKSGGRPPVLLSSILRDNTTSTRKAKKLAPLMLTTPEMISKHTPLTMHPTILPLELSCRLFHAMIKASEEWSRNKWWLADRMVESPHTTSFYARRGQEDDYDWNEAAQYWQVMRILALVSKPT